MKLYFTNEDYYYKAMAILNSECNASVTRKKAFYLLVHGLSFKDLDNLCGEISRYFRVTKEDAYRLLQDGNEDVIDKALSLAYNLVNREEMLGTNVINNNINTSSWLSHSLNEARLCEILARKINLDKDIAFNYGLLHDYGRKITHNFSHTIKGFEALVDMGLKESRACLTHSFINDGRFNNNELPDEKLEFVGNKEHFENEYDDLSKLLRNVTYTDYDRILNIADLMASDKGILSPIDRIYDILSRRGDLDKAPTRVYFLTSFYNTLLWYLNKINYKTDFEYLDFNKLTLDEIYKYLDSISKVFYDVVMERDYIHGNNIKL